ncbi:MAG: DUF4422 domain-containing protein [Selenomonadaceae bacterium]|nr:DUF4422 domain-containing protein [Selenomonadaceae bacterium]
MATYVPRVLVCGSMEEFIKKIGNKPVEVVGQILFDKTDDGAKLFLGGRALTDENIRLLLDGAADYLIFVDALDFYYFLKKFSPSSQVVPVETFVRKIHGGFSSKETFLFLEGLLIAKKIGRALDFDAFLAASGFRMHTIGFNSAVDCLAEKVHPIMENVYGKIFRAFDECKFHHFDALILSKERSPEEFVDALIKTDALSENIFAFVRKNSALEKFLAAQENFFASVERFSFSNGSWFHIKKIVPPADVCVYVVTHKDAKLSALPAGYKFIHAGHARAKNFFGYAGDDSGSNISRLNPFLDEATALYWIWKNTSHSIVGLVHYRRFLTTDDNQKIFDAEKILSAEEILKLLDEYDIITHHENMFNRPQRDMIILSTGQPDLVKVTEKIVRSHLARVHPDYLDAFDDLINGVTLFPAAIQITRRNIFNAYCEWLFSFLLDATEEIRDKIELRGKSLEEMGHDYSRVVGHFAERLMTVWLMKNHLRIKTLPTMFREDV